MDSGLFTGSVRFAQLSLRLHRWRGLHVDSDDGQRRPIRAHLRPGEHPMCRRLFALFARRRSFVGRRQSTDLRVNTPKYCIVKWMTNPDNMFRGVIRSQKIQVKSKKNAIIVVFHSSYYTSGGAFSCVAQAVPLADPGPSPAPGSCECGVKGMVK